MILSRYGFQLTVDSLITKHCLNGNKLYFKKTSYIHICTSLDKELNIHRFIISYMYYMFTRTVGILTFIFYASFGEHIYFTIDFLMSLKLYHAYCKQRRK